MPHASEGMRTFQTSSEVVNQIGWPGEQNLYRVDFRMPKTTGSTAALQVSAAWIGGTAFPIPVQ